MKLWKHRGLKLKIVLALSIAGVGVWFFAYGRPLTVEVVQPEQDVEIQVFGLGTVEARVLSKVGFEAGGALKELHADHGDQVTQGTVLARLYSAEQEARLAKSKAGVTQAEAALQKAESSVAKAKALLKQKQVFNQRNQQLVRSRTVSQEVAEDAQTAEDVARTEVVLAVSEVEVARANLENARAQLRMDEVLLRYHELRAPYDAIVVTRHKELGSVMSPGEALFTLIDPATAWVRFYVDEAAAGGLREGLRAMVRLRSLPREKFPARVVRIDLESDRVNEERRVYVKCDPCPSRFFLGEQAEVHVTTGRLERALLVPQTAVEGFDGVSGRVWTVEKGHLVRRMFTFGEKTLDGRLEIRGGVPEGVMVLRSLRGGLREGRRVLVRGEASR